ncbi:MAG TPA: PA14 domain-containing protein [Anaerolineae bacterium]|nr:PA14 domain-containing protein [Anaerolineae bacterium]HQK13786.1 PA14 domain-containing protein [Anaerolineae bacterium]
MLKRISVITLLMLVLMLAVPVGAQGPGPQHSDPTWQASYWNNLDLAGTPVLQRAEPDIFYEWWTNSPAPGIVNADNFSVRWTRYIDVTPGTYLFTATADDGIRIWVDNDLILDQWYEHSVLTFTVEKYLGAGHHLIKVEYFEKAGVAIAKVQWQLKSQPPITQWRGEYFNNITLGGTPVLVRNDAAINFDWGTGSPAPGIVNADRFSVRWTQTLNFTAAMYRFILTVDDGARLWVNGHLLIDAWIDQAPRTYTGDIYLPTGPATVELQYYENTERAVAQLSWSGGATPPPTPPPPSAGTVIVDDRDSGFVKGGPIGGWRYENEGYNNNLTWTTNNYNANANYNWGRWFPQLTARRYEVFVYIPHRFTTTGQARYWINHADGYTLRIVDQSAYSNQWVSLGTYRFRGTGDDYVSLADVTFEPTRSRLIAFDAVKWEPR